MKHSLKSFIIASVMMPIIVSCTYIPWTQEWKIKKAATFYIEKILNNGEKMIWRRIQCKKNEKIDGRNYTYVEVKYTIVSDKGDVDKTLYLLFSKDCNYIYSASVQKLQY